MLLELLNLADASRDLLVAELFFKATFLDSPPTKDSLVLPGERWV